MLIPVLLSIVIIFEGILLVMAFRHMKALTANKQPEATSLLAGEMARMERVLKEEFQINRQETAKSARDTREELISFLRTFRDTISQTMTDIAGLQKNQLESFSGRIDTMSKAINENLEKIRQVLEVRIKELQEDNSRKLEQMRATVDEKLQSTLEKRLSESFQVVSGRLEEVHKGLGEMRTLAANVGDLKRVLGEVKPRGILGELQLGALLEQMLSPEQYARNVIVIPGSRNVVEYAIKLPGKEEEGKPVWLPVDSKFPLKVYEELLDAYQGADPVLIEEKSKVLEATILSCAKDIHDKYIQLPHTTNFAIMFLPVEGLFAEVVRRPGFIETLQRQYKIVITGPTTLAALLNSLQLGFRTLAIEKRSSEVFSLLGAVKSEFEKFGEVLKRAQEKIRKAGDDIDELVGRRTRQIQRKLKDVHELPAPESKLLLGEAGDNEDNGDNGDDETEESS